MTVIISWHWSLRGNFLVDTLRYLSWSDLSRSWHLAASGMGLGVISHQVGLLTTLHHNYPASTSVLLSKEAIWRPPRVEGSQILGTHSVLPYRLMKLTCIITIYHCCIYSVVMQINVWSPFPLREMIMFVHDFVWGYTTAIYIPKGDFHS